MAVFSASLNKYFLFQDTLYNSKKKLYYFENLNINFIVKTFINKLIPRLEKEIEDNKNIEEERKLKSKIVKHSKFDYK